MKKLLSILLTLALVLSMSTAVFADAKEAQPDTNPTITKWYNPLHGVEPGETFTYKFQAVSWKDNNGTVSTDVTNVPAIGDVTIGFNASSADQTGSAAIDIDASKYDLGVYTYEVTEVAGKTAGVTYTTDKLYMVLTIYRDETSGTHYVAAMHFQTVGGDKVSTLTNTYDSGSLTIKKLIKGNMAKLDKKFKFTVTLTAPAGTVLNSTIYANNAEASGTLSADKTTYTYTVDLSNEESVTLSNIPAGVTYTVTEDSDNYTSDGGVFSDTTKTISGGDEDKATFTNTLTSEIDTGINLDSLPYILLLAVVCVGLFGFLSKKRMMHR